jgi:hypothetical protein
MVGNGLQDYKVLQPGNSTSNLQIYIVQQQKEVL